MGSELMPCPVCGAECNVSASYFEPGANVLCDRECGYFIHCAVDKIPAGETHECQIAEVHNTLARRAEIGALIERIVAGGCLRLYEYGCESEGFSYGTTTRLHATTTGKDAGGKSLLDALRSLAAELEVSGE